MSANTDITRSDVTLVKDAIHNPHEPRHFMRIVPSNGRQTVTVAGRVISQSDNAVIVKEVGRDIYDPLVYFPRSDVDMHALIAIDKTTHCPLKGDTEYFDIVLGDVHISAAAWSYVDMVAGGPLLELLELIAFDPIRVDHAEGKKIDKAL